MIHGSSVADTSAINSPNLFHFLTGHKGRLHILTLRSKFEVVNYILANRIDWHIKPSEWISTYSSVLLKLCVKDGGDTAWKDSESLNWAQPSLTHIGLRYEQNVNLYYFKSRFGCCLLQQLGMFILIQHPI